MSHQPDLPFFGSDTHFQRWRGEVETWRAELERKLGLPLGSNVQVFLTDFEKPFIGILEWVVGTKESDPRLRIRGLRFDFSFNEIVSIHLLDGPTKKLDHSGN